MRCGPITKHIVLSMRYDNYHDRSPADVHSLFRVWVCAQCASNDISREWFERMRNNRRWRWTWLLKSTTINKIAASNGHEHVTIEHTFDAWRTEFQLYYWLFLAQNWRVKRKNKVSDATWIHSSYHPSSINACLITHFYVKIERPQICFDDNLSLLLLPFAELFI